MACSKSTQDAIQPLSKQSEHSSLCADHSDHDTQHRCRPRPQRRCFPNLDHREVTHLLARRRELASQSAQDRPDPDIRVQCQCGVSAGKHVFRSHSPAFSESSCAAGGGQSSKLLSRLNGPSPNHGLQLECATERPIIFICHSLGGIIIKRVSRVVWF
jgi:hypothetical protein